MLSFYGNGADGGGSTVEQLWERGSGEGSVKQILINTTVENDASGKESVAQGTQTTASGQSSHAEGYLTVAASTASHAEGNGTTASGSHSHAEGYQTKAIHTRAHAEGADTIASGESAHAEGFGTTASSGRAHSEGYQTLASATDAHAEGWKTVSSETRAHAEGQSTTASGYYSHSEGCRTLASAQGSHAQNYHTIAASSYQTALGKYNIEDNQNQYAVILGNGTSSNARSNAAMIDWSGNFSIAGGLTLDMNSTNAITINAGSMIYIGNALMRAGSFIDNIVNISFDNNNNYYLFDNGIDPISWTELKNKAYILKETHVDANNEQEYVTDYHCEEVDGHYYLQMITFCGLNTTGTPQIKYNYVKYEFSSADQNIATSRIYNTLGVNYTQYN